MRQFHRSNKNLFLSSFQQRLSRFAILFPCLLLLSCEKSEDGIVDSIGSAPTLLNAYLSPSSINTDTINVASVQSPDDLLTIRFQAFAKVTHAAGLSSVSRVNFSFTDGSTQESISSGVLLDNGVPPDQKSGDSLYSAAVTFQIPRSKAGNFLFQISAEDPLSYRSNEALLPLRVFRLNRPPVLSNLQAPDTVHTSLVSSFLITVQATDPDGLADIRSVSRITPSGLVLPLNDSGANGDAVAGDGTFTETVSVNPPPPNGAYDFRFQATDKFNVPSNILTHRIVIAP
ncbi:MAG: choice-of-anchor X domain-containing protein [Bacteroidota bacterium]